MEFTFLSACNVSAILTYNLIQNIVLIFSNRLYYFIHVFQSLIKKKECYQLINTFQLDATASSISVFTLHVTQNFVSQPCKGPWSFEPDGVLHCPYQDASANLNLIYSCMYLYVYCKILDLRDDDAIKHVARDEAPSAPEEHLLPTNNKILLSAHKLYITLSYDMKKKENFSAGGAFVS